MNDHLETDPRPDDEPAGDHEIAVIGMSVRFPGAPDVESFWRNLRDGVESITFFTEEELAVEVEPALLADPRYVRAKAMIEGEDQFDAGFFGFTPREAEIRDPQHRVFLECAWEALEHAGCDPERYPEPIAVYAGAGSSAYAWNVLQRAPGLLASVGTFQIALANEKDYLPTLISYKLGLRGPSFSVQCACSTSLVAIHLACQSLAGYECDMALAGGVTLGVPQRGGYLYQEGGILSPDGHCRAFDARARGTAPGNGAGVVVLKRLADALADGDTIAAVVKGSAVNNDGGNKVGYTAPSVDGQREVIGAALAMAGVAARDVSYVEAHGTGTSLGDPIEIAALTQAFQDDVRLDDAGREPHGDGGEEASGDARGFCAVGSVKSNFGHLDTAAGVAGFVKTVLALQHRQLPPTLHVERENPAIDFAASPFYLNRKLQGWEPDRLPRRAGVSSFGIGGTNAHVILEEAPAPLAAEAEGNPARPLHLLPLSARSPAALARVAERLRGHLDRHPELDLADVAYTLQLGRKPFEVRRAVLTDEREEASRLLGEAATSDRAVLTGVEASRSARASHDAASHDAASHDLASHDPGARGPARQAAPRVAFLLPGQGAQYPAMAAELYRNEPTFRGQLDRCSELLAPHWDHDLRRLLYDQENDPDAGARLARTDLAQPALFAVEYALARLWMEWGVEPAAMAGHSLGELVAACLAGVLPLEAALPLVVARGRLMQSMAAGSMLAVSMAEEELEPRLPAGLSIAAVNAPAACTVSGPGDAIEAFARALAVEKIASRPLHTSHAFHSASADAILEAWEEEVSAVDLQAPRIPFVSNLSGTWITDDEATDPRYWALHLRHGVRFSDVAHTLLSQDDLALLEVGPGHTLQALVRKQPAARGRLLAGSLPHPGGEGRSAEGGDHDVMLASLARLWTQGCPIDWAAFQRHARRRRVPLPTYPFERRRHWAGDRGGYRAVGTEAEAEAAPRVAPPRRAEPGGTLEATLAEIWRELLGVEAVALDDDFFDLGGDSLSAVSLMSLIEERLGKALPVSALTRGATVAELARQVRATQTTSPLVELRATTRSDDGAPWVWIHPIGGDVLCYLDLARRLEGDGPVLAIRAPGLEAGEQPLTSVEEMAERYLTLLQANALLRGVAPEGPYRLGGWSFGGLVAYEMGRRLAAGGAAVERITLLDSAPISPADLEAALGASALGGSGGNGSGGDGLPGADSPGILAWFLRDLLGGRLTDPEGLTEQLAGLPSAERLDLLTERAVAAGALTGRAGAERLRRLLAVFAANLAAGLRYRPKPFAGDVLLVEAAEGTLGRPRDGWAGLITGHLEAHSLPANHYSLMDKPQVERVADLLATAAALPVAAAPV